MTGYVYGVVCPKAKMILYVGSTYNDLQARLRAHMSGNYGASFRLYQYCYFMEIEPFAVVLEEVSFRNKETLRRRETHWIRRISRQSPFCFNRAGNRWTIYGLDGKIASTEAYEEWLSLAKEDVVLRKGGRKYRAQFFDVVDYISKENPIVVNRSCKSEINAYAKELDRAITDRFGPEASPRTTCNIFGSGEYQTSFSASDDYTRMRIEDFIAGFSTRHKTDKL
jgi:predicted GIY-YIG superfamily endonuclease